VYLCCEYTLFWSVQPVSILPLSLPSHTPLLDNFQCVSFCLPEQIVMYFDVVGAP
jgi:hypothetical protein